MNKRILVTGGRNWINYNLIYIAILEQTMFLDPTNVTIVHGDAKGADTIAGGIARKLGMTEESHPADWNTHHRAAGPIRNQKMVDLGADVCLAIQPGGKMTYYEEDVPENESEADWIEHIKQTVNDNKSHLLFAPVTQQAANNQHQELMEMLGGIFVQLSRVYDVLMLSLDLDDRTNIDNMHERGELMASPPVLIENAWSEDETIQNRD